MKDFEENVAGNPKIAMIHVSLDRDKESAQSWAAKEQFPWYTVLPKYVEKSGLRKYKKTNSVPEYALVSADGERLGSGSGVLKQAAKLTK